MKTISYEEIGQSTTPTTFINVSKNMPCPICEHTDWCSVTDDGWTVFCHRSGDDSQKKTDKNGGDYWIHKLAKPIKISNSSPLKSNSNATLAEPEILHNIYQSMLKKLDLSDAHLQNLNARGLTDEKIEQIGYRTLPEKNRSIIAAELVYEFTPETCLQVPGIIRLTRDGQEKITIYGPAGLLIPVRDNDGFIISIKVRTDSTQEGQSKYRYLTSTKHNGPSPGAQVHVPLYDGPTSTVRVTEGELKADITTMLSKTLTLSIPGVSNYKPVIPVLKRLGAKKVIIAFDADCREKTHVADALQNAVCELTKEGFQIELETWDKDYGKGIDDLLSSGHQPEIVSGGCLWATLMDIVKSAGTGPLKEVLMRDAFYSLIEQIKTNPKEVIISALDDLGIVEPLSYMKLHDPETLDANLLKLQYYVGPKDIKTLKGLMDLCNENVSEVKAPSSLMKVIDVFSDAPINPQVVIPNLYKLTKDGIYFGEDPKRIRVAYAPIILTAIFKNIKDNAETFKLAWLRDKEWESCIIPRADAVDAKKITAWGRKGLPVTSENAKHLITYLAIFEKKNYLLLKAKVTNQMGWMDDDLEHGFIWGKSYIQNDGTIIDDISIKRSNITGGNYICFQGADIGDEELSSAYTSVGSFDEWRRTANSVSSFPRVLFALYTAFVPPLLSILDIDNFVVDWGHRTSTGKSTSLCFAASVWGNPNKRSRKGASVVRTWNTSAVWIERAASNLVGIPLIMDDTKDAKKQNELVAETIYKIASGQGKGRGSLDGTATTRTWQTVLLTSGELKAVDYSQDGGTHGRTITIGGAPFSPESPDMAVFVKKFGKALMDNYGHAGPKFVQYIISNKVMWDEWREKHKQIEEELMNKSSKNSVIYRQVSYLAAIDLAARLAHTALELPWEYKSPVVTLWDEFSSQAKEANKAVVALKYVVDWALSHPNTFFNREVYDYSDRTPTGGWSGRWDAGDDWDYIAFIPTKLEELLKKENYDCSTIKRSWKENDWLIVEKGRSDTRYTVAGARTRVIAIKKAAIDEVYYKD